MKDSLTMAHINLFAILKSLEDLCELDSEMRRVIRDKNISIQFEVRNGPSALLRFVDGKCSLKSDSGQCDIKLFFNSPEHLNDMFEGKATPIPLKGFMKLNFLKNEFTRLTDKLSYYLKPNDSLLKDADYFKINTILSAYVAFFAVAAIGNNDKIGKRNASKISDGILSIFIKDGPALYLEFKEGVIMVQKGLTKAPSATMRIDSLETANAILTGKMEVSTCIATGRIQVNGCIPMIDNMNKILAQVPEYFM